MAVKCYIRKQSAIYGVKKIILVINKFCILGIGIEEVIKNFSRNKSFTDV